MVQIVHLDRVDFKRKKFLTKSGAEYLACRGIHPSVYIALSDGRRIHRGEWLIYNHELEKRTKQATSWMVYGGAYAALRGMVHALRAGGAQPDVTNGELQELALHPRILRKCVPILFSSATQSEYIKSATEAGADFLITSLQDRRNSDLLFERVNALRGMKLEDALGKRNPGAAAMNVGGAIQRVQDRDVGLRVIMSRLNMRVIQIGEMIQQAVDAYDDLLALLGGAKREYSERATVIRAVNRQFYSERLAGLAADQIVEIIHRMESIIALPSLKNAQHTAQDLRGMHHCLKRLSKGWDASSVNLMEGWIDLIRQAILWFRALHVLETEIYAPLSWVLGDIARNAKIVRRVVHDPQVTLEDTISVEDQTRLLVIEQRMMKYRQRVLKSSDSRLRQHIKAPVLRCVDEALLYAGSRDWIETKKQLGEIPRIL